MVLWPSPRRPTKTSLPARLTTVSFYEQTNAYCSHCGTYVSQRWQTFCPRCYGLLSAPLQRQLRAARRQPFSKLTQLTNRRILERCHERLKNLDIPQVDRPTAKA